MYKSITRIMPASNFHSSNPYTQSSKTIFSYIEVDPKTGSIPCNQTWQGTVLIYVALWITNGKTYNGGIPIKEDS